MQKNSWWARTIALVVAVLMTGCESSFTYKLWKTEEFRHVREPASDPSVTVSYSERQKDFLISFDSVRDGGDAPQRLNFFLGENQERIEVRQKPNFIGTNKLVLMPVSLNAEKNILPRAIFEQRLTIYTATGEIGPYALPHYAESTGVTAKILLTPLAVAGDVTCVSLFAAAIVGIGFFYSGVSLP
jgi:hypothetical protein